MSSSSKEMPQFNLPPPPGEQASMLSREGKADSKKPEHQAAGAEKASSPASAQPFMSAQATATAQSYKKAKQSDDNATTSTTKQPLLEDSDLIEKEWVNKAKRIVENTRNDPHKQSEELTLMKADYMKQHYGKTIKLK